jgi:hypothetical protein
VPVNHSDGPLSEACDPILLMSIYESRHLAAEGPGIGTSLTSHLLPILKTTAAFISQQMHMKY